MVVSRCTVCMWKKKNSLLHGQSKFSTECDLVLPPSISIISSFPWNHVVASYVFFLVFSLICPSCIPSITCSKRQFLRKIWPMQLALLLFVGYSFPPWLNVIHVLVRMRDITQHLPNLSNKVQGEHKVFPWLQTFFTRKLRGIQTYSFFTIT